MRFSLRHLVLLINKKRYRAVLLAFFVSLFSWLAINLSKNYSRSATVILTYKNKPNNLVFQTSDSTLTVELEGSGFAFLNANIQDQYFEIDLKDNKDYWSYKRNLSRLKKQLFDNLNVVSIRPDTVFFNATKLESKTVPIKKNITIQCKLGYGVTHSGNFRDSVTVFGTKSVLNSIAYIPTDTVVYDNLDKAVEGRVYLQSVHESLRYEIDYVNYSYDIERFTEGEFQLPITVVNVPVGKNVTIFPNQVKVRFQCPLTAYEYLDASQFRVQVDFGKAIDEGALPIELIKKPVQVKNVSLLKLNVEYLIIDQK